MCTVSMIGDHYGDKWRPWIQPQPTTAPPIYPSTGTGGTFIINPQPGPTKEEFDTLKREVEDVKKLLLKAKAYDEANGEPDCEMESKIEILRKMGELVGVDLDEVFGSR